MKTKCPVIFNGTGVAEAVLQTPPSLINSFINWLSESSFSSKSSRHCLSQTVRGSGLNFWQNVQPLPHVTCYMSCVPCPVPSSFTSFTVSEFSWKTMFCILSIKYLAGENVSELGVVSGCTCVLCCLLIPGSPRLTSGTKGCPQGFRLTQMQHLQKPCGLSELAAELFSLLKASVDYCQPRRKTKNKVLT